MTEHKNFIRVSWDGAEVLYLHSWSLAIAISIAAAVILIVVLIAVWGQHD